MAKEKMVFFRSALGGFNKSDVNSYIEKLNIEFSERERVLKKKIEALETKSLELENAKKDLAKATDEIADLKKQADMRENVINEYRESIDAQKAEIERLEQMRVASENEISELSNRIDSLSDAISKSEKYDDISAQIGEIILSARQTAEAIVAKANKDAEIKRATAEEQIENAAKSFNARAATAVYTVKNQIKKLAQDSYSKIAEQAAETSDMLRNLAAHISGSSEYLDSKLSEGKSEVESAIEEETAKVFSDSNRITFKNN